MMYLIAAMTTNGVIGKGNELPWNIPDEMKNFRQLTTGTTVIMGTKTFESIGRPLPNRHNIVLGPQGLHIAHVDVCNSVKQALATAQTYAKDIFIIGGAYTYAQFLPLVDRMYISYIKQNYEGDIMFPEVDWSAWKIIERVDYPEFERILYQRK
jgi:dihydrofolate reductase